MTRTTVTIETETCGRCGGSGRYSYNRMTGDRCFGCAGSGQRNTRRGERSLELLKAWRAKHWTVAASSLSIGDKVQYSYRWLTVTAVDVQLGYGLGKSRVGDAESWTLGRTHLSFDKGPGLILPAHAPMVKAPTYEQKLAYWEFAEGLPGVTINRPAPVS